MKALLAAALIVLGFSSAHAQLACKNGEEVYTQEQDGTTDHGKRVYNLCVDGKFTQPYEPKAAAPLFLKCIEGEYHDLVISGGRHPKHIFTICKDGKWTTPYAPKEAAPQFLTCKDGEIFVDEEYVNGSDHTTRLLKICKDGKFVLEF